MIGRSIGLVSGWRHAACVPLLGAALALTACSSTSPTQKADTSDPYQADLALAASRTTSDYLKAVLANGKVDDAEYETSVDRYVGCVNAKFPQIAAPFAKQRKSNGLYRFTFTGPTELVKAQSTTDIQDACFDEFMGDASLIFEAQRKNPEKLSAFELVKTCLSSQGLVTDSYTEKNWVADQYYDAIDAGATVGGDANGAPDRADATSFDAVSDAATRCLSGG